MPLLRVGDDRHSDAVNVPARPAREQARSPAFSGPRRCDRWAQRPSPTRGRGPRRTDDLSVPWPMAMSRTGLAMNWHRNTRVGVRLGATVALTIVAMGAIG